MLMVANCPNIIDKDTFDKVQTLIILKVPKDEKENPHLFSDIFVVLSVMDLC